MPKDKPQILKDVDVECCICYGKDSLVNQPCGISEHKICTPCIEKIIKTIPIKEGKPEISCQYPFDDCKIKYNDGILEKILKERYMIYRIASDKYTYQDCGVEYCPNCESVLVFEEDIEDGYIYDCTYCLNSFCFRCKTQCFGSNNSCFHCSGYPNINPYSYNYFFYKSNRQELTDYFYINAEVDPLDACKQIIQKITELSVRCPICITPMQRSEQCNSLKHCHVEICSNCGKFSKIGESLGDHWSARGYGCARWETDEIYSKLTPTFSCREGLCYSHEKGDCTDSSHETGKSDFSDFRKKQYIYHSLKSLLPRIRYDVIDLLPESLEEYVPSAEVFDYIDCNERYEQTKSFMQPAI
jgi:hypothetical protein